MAMFGQRKRQPDPNPRPPVGYEAFEQEAEAEQHAPWFPQDPAPAAPGVGDPYPNQPTPGISGLPGPGHWENRGGQDVYVMDPGIGDAPRPPPSAIGQPPVPPGQGAPGGPAADPYGWMDLSQPGAGEVGSILAGGRLGDPEFGHTGQIEDALQRLTGVSGYEQGLGTLFMSGAAMAGEQNPAYQWFQQFDMPNIQERADLSSYYDEAVRHAAEDIESRGASAGRFGHSVTRGMTNQAIQSLRAQQAKEEADYALKALAEERGWQGMGGYLAQMASQGPLSWNQAMTNLGLGLEDRSFQEQIAQLQGWGLLDSQEAQRLTASAGILGQGQVLHDNRIMSVLNQLGSFTADMSAMASATYGDIFTGENAALEQQVAMMLGYDAATLRFNSNAKLEVINTAAQVASIIASIKGGGSGAPQQQPQLPGGAGGFDLPNPPQTNLQPPGDLNF